MTLVWHIGVEILCYYNILVTVTYVWIQNPSVIYCNNLLIVQRDSDMADTLPSELDIYQGNLSMEKKNLQRAYRESAP